MTDRGRSVPGSGTAAALAVRTRAGWVYLTTVAVLSGFSVRGAADAQEPVVLVGATLVDPLLGEPLADARITVADGRFTCVSGPAGCPRTGDAREVDLTGLWITPGLIDTHVHADYEWNPERAASMQALRFALGITTVRDAGGLQLEAILAERERARAASHPYPRVTVAARPVAPYDERFGVSLGAPLVEHLDALGIDAIKLKDHLWDDALWEEEVRTAVRLGLPVFGHTWRGPPTEGLTHRAIEVGVNGVSHLIALPPETQPDGFDVRAGPTEDDPLYWAWEKELWLTVDTAKLDALTEEMLTHRVWLEPMLVSEYYWGLPVRPPPSLGFLRGTPPRLRDLVRGHDVLSDPVEPAFPAPYARMAAFVRSFHERGGVVVTGGDSKRPGLDLHREVALLREAGLAPMAALRAATLDPAEALARRDLGAIEPGRLGDAVVYEADPMGAPGNTVRIRYVIKGGQIYEEADLLRPFREEYAARVRVLWLRRAGRAAPFAAAVVIVAAIALLLGRRLSRGMRGAA